MKIRNINKSKKDRRKCKGRSKDYMRVNHRDLLSTPTRGIDTIFFENRSRETKKIYRKKFRAKSRMFTYYQRIEAEKEIYNYEKHSI